jgi:hypothetical protein
MGPTGEPFTYFAAGRSISEIEYSSIYQSRTAFTQQETVRYESGRGEDRNENSVAGVGPLSAYD